MKRLAHLKKAMERSYHGPIGAAVQKIANRWDAEAQKMASFNPIYAQQIVDMAQDALDVVEEEFNLGRFLKPDEKKAIRARRDRRRRQQRIGVPELLRRPT